MSTETKELVPATATELPEPVIRRGIGEPQWRTLCDNLYPGADPRSVLMVWDYCQARKLDPLKKPCHIVPMEVKDAKTNTKAWRDVVMPGIYEYRTTAHRTGLYLGHTEPAYGEKVKTAGVDAPDWCAMTMYRWSPDLRIKAEFPVKVHFREVVGTTREGAANSRWTKAPIQMLTKCTEAAGLREAFPEEFGGEPTAEEMDGQQTIDIQPIPPPQPAQRKSQQPANVEKPAETSAQGSAPPPAPAPPTPPELVTKPNGANVGVVALLVQQPAGTVIKLDSAFQCVTRDPEMVKALGELRDKGRRVELVTKAQSNPKYLPVLVEIQPVDESGK